MNRPGLPSIPAWRPSVILGYVGANEPDGKGGKERISTTRNPWDTPEFFAAMRNGHRASESARIAALLAAIDSRNLSKEDADASAAERILTGTRGRGRPPRK